MYSVIYELLEESVIIRSVNLETVVGVTSTLPVHDRPEIAFAGRSNVGKSSLLNALVGRKALARTSSEPGKTQTINFYEVNEDCYFVDLPGYGYAKTSKETREKWGRMIERYLKTSGSLRAIVVLVDMRHEPTKDDLKMVEWVRASGLTLIPVLTKQDKLSANEQAKMKKTIRTALNIADGEPVYPISSEKKTGIPELMEAIDRILKERRNG